MMGDLICYLKFIISGVSEQKAVTALHEHSDLGLCSGPDPMHRVEKRSYLPPISCTDEHELDAVRKKVHCTPRPRVVQLPWPNDTSVHQVGRTAKTDQYFFLLLSSQFFQEIQLILLHFWI